MAIETDTETEISWFEKLSQALLREPKDREQLIQLLRDAHVRKLLDHNALAMIEGVLHVEDMQVRDIMIPSSQVISLPYDAPLADILPIITESAHSRFPVLDETQEEVIGILLAKDLLRYALGEDNSFNLKSILRPATIVPESKRLDCLLQEFRINRNHMALVVDEYGALAGLVTIEDVLEQIVGDIADEYDIDEELYIKRQDHHYIIKAITPLANFNDYFHSHLSEHEFDTIGGFVVQQLGHLPKRGEKIVIPPFQFEIMRADRRRVYLLRVQVEE